MVARIVRAMMSGAYRNRHIMLDDDNDSGDLETLDDSRRQRRASAPTSRC